MLRERRRVRAARETLGTGVADLAAGHLDLVGDADESVVLGDTLRTARGTGLDLASAERDDEVRDGRAVSAR